MSYAGCGASLDGHGPWMPHEPGVERCARCGTRRPAGADAGAVRLTVQELGQLKLAAAWGLVRSLEGRRIAPTGRFSMDAGDLARLVGACGGQLLNSWQADLGDVDVVLQGRAGDATLVDWADQCLVQVWSEADLVEAITPSLADLTRDPAEPPF